MQKRNQAIDITKAESVSITRRLAALLYDLFLISAVLILAAAFAVLPAGLIFDYQIPANHWLYQLYLLSWPTGFYLWFWTRGGQTLGMRAWRFRVIRMDGNNLSILDAIKRLLATLLTLATAGIGFFWSIIDPENRTWHDKLSGTTLVMLQKREKKKAST